MFVSLCNFAEFKALAEKQGLTARDCGNGHWQVRGGARIVNYYPDRGTVYVCGDSGSKRNCKPERAVQAALAGPLKPQELPKSAGSFAVQKPEAKPVEKSGSYKLKGGFLADTKPE